MIHSEQISTSDTEFLLREDTQQKTKKRVVTCMLKLQGVCNYTIHIYTCTYIYTYTYNYAPCC